MPVLAVLEILVKVYFAVHVVKTGRDRYWLWIIIFFPGIGSLVYFFAEFVPDLQGNYKVRKFGTGFADRINPARRLRDLENRLELAPTIQNRKLLAEECIHLGMFDKAIELYRDCMQGMYENDIVITEGLCCAYYFKKDLTNAKACLERLLEISPDRKSGEFGLLYAKTLEESGEIDKALDYYAGLEKSFAGEEARCRYALLLKKTGKTGEAGKVFDTILKNARLSPKFYVRAQKKWINIAKKEKR